MFSVVQKVLVRSHFVLHFFAFYFQPTPPTPSTPTTAVCLHDLLAAHSLAITVAYRRSLWGLHIRNQVNKQDPKPQKRPEEEVVLATVGGGGDENERVGERVRGSEWITKLKLLILWEAGYLSVNMATST